MSQFVALHKGDADDDRPCREYDPQALTRDLALTEARNGVMVVARLSKTSNLGEAKQTWKTKRKVKESLYIVMRHCCNLWPRTLLVTRLC